MAQERITRTDLEWWCARAAEVEWTWAKTYAETAPHSYLVAGRTAGMGSADYVRAARVIHTFGRPAKFYGMTSLYLTSPDGRVKWWTMDQDVRQTGLVNQATTKRLYGVQNAPFTESGIETPYDAVATSWDHVRPTPARLESELRELFGSLAGPYRPTVLDVGCGTGRVLDLGLASPDRYAGVDPSTPMLNQLVRKHPTVGAVYPMCVEQALADGLFTPGQFDIVTVIADAGQRWDAETIRALSRVPSRGLVVAHGRELSAARAHSARSGVRPAAD